MVIDLLQAVYALNIPLCVFNNLAYWLLIFYTQIFF